MNTLLIKLFALTILSTFSFSTFSVAKVNNSALQSALRAAGVKPANNRIPLVTQSKIAGSITEYLVSEKLDGVRGVWDGKQLLTRTGRAIIVPDWFINKFPDYPLDGELWMGRGTFEQMSGLARRKIAVEKEWHKVIFMVFDFPQNEVDFGKRYQIFEKKLANVSPYLKVIKQKQVSSLDELDIWFEQVVNLGGEGLMLHHQTSFYIAGRNRDLIKLKPLYDAEATVIEHLPGKGKFNGLLGALLVETPKGLRFKIGTGFTLEDRRHPPEVGAMVTYQYSGLTQKGTPRFASFLRVRFSE